SPKVGKKLPVLRECVASLSVRDAIPQIEVAVGEDGAALVFRHLKPLNEKDINKLIQFGKEYHFHIYLQPGGNDSVHKIWPEDGVQRLHYSLPDFQLSMAFHPLDFTQVNPALNQKMVKQALELLDPQADETVLDLFCGLGNFTLPLARHAKQVIGVEGSAAMVLRGEENAAANGITNAQFYAADLTQDFAAQPWGQLKFDKILIDPPRTGALEIVQKLAQFGAKRLVYVSCNPATLARDAGELQQLGYQLTHAGVMDMFPHTTHVESIAVFERIKA
ncbi:MAG TPA: 23S rRNA (uracil(1939)-C(5))-methyltransferase RlmD, partial [Pseudomonadales bacterium]|nr:23S rRNA (uracil(1939)-C(5))-methyltransferase RlmD [Pseudomonadales bacterium]